MLIATLALGLLAASPEPPASPLAPALPAEPSLPAAPAPPGLTATTVAEAKAPEAQELNFELLPPLAPPDANEALVLEHEVHVRRSLIQWHQGLGIATALLLTATVIAGQLDYTDRFGGGTSTGQYEGWHTTFAAAATTTFAIDGLLALFAPVPYPKEDHSVSSLTIHKLSMIVATLGFAAEVPLGIITVAREGYTDQPTLALAHLVVGYVTTAAVAAGVTALAF